MNVNAAIKALNSGASIEDIFLISADDADEFNRAADTFSDDVKMCNEQVIDHTVRQNTWSFPSEYLDINLNEHFMSLCSTDEQRSRVTYELSLYDRLEMNNLLRWCLWFMDVVKEKHLFIGVGRGSSVASYCLYLVGLHMVDSIKYGIEPVEFFKEI